MPVDVHFNSPTVADLQIEMAVLLHGHRPAGHLANGPVTNAEIVARSEPVAPPKRQTAAEKKAAEKAAAEAAASTGQSISSGEERTDPAADKQDAADEAAEKPFEPVKLTHDSVRAVLGGYVQAFGMAAAQEDGSKLIAIAKISEIPDTQAALAKAVLAIADGIENNPYQRALVGDGITPEKVKDLVPTIAAARLVK